MTKLFTLKSIAILFFVLCTSLVFAHGVVITPFGRPAGNPITIKGAHLNSSPSALGNRHLKPLHKKGVVSGYPVAPPSPTITGFSPSNGPVGTSVIISGTNFNATNTGNIVFFGATRATVTAATQSSLTVTVPVGATYQPISVLNGSTQLTGYSASPFIVTFSPNNSNITSANFFSQQDLSPRSSSTAQYMTTGDLDGDGKVDMVSVNSDATTNNISIFPNISSSGTLTAASFAAKIELPLDGAPGGIAIGDLDGDGKPELIALDVSGKVSIFRNTCTNGVISFAPKVDLPVLNGVSVTIGDLDNDGKADVIVSDRKDGTVFVFRNTSTSGNLSFANAIAAATFATGTGGPENVAIGDLDGDGKVDMTVANKVSGLVSIFPNISTTGNIAFGIPIVLTPGTKPVKAALGDFNADGKPDLVVANSTSSTVSVFQNTSSVGHISFTAKVDLPADNKVTTVVVADLDGDGKVDIVSVAVNGGGIVSFFRNIYTSGTIAVSSFAAKSLLNSLLDDATIGDIDGDGRPDLAGTNLKVVSLLRYNPFITKISASFCGNIAANVDSAVTADPVPSATAYRFRLTKDAAVQTIDAQTNSFKFNQLTNYAYNASYSIDVQVQAGGSWSDYGPACVVTTPGPLTEISASFSGKTLLNVDSVITADPISSATGYRFRVTKGAAVQTIDAETNSFKMKDLANYAYNTQYSMDVAVKTSAVVGAFGPVSLVTTPPVPITQVTASYCGSVLTDLDGAVRADALPLATAYRFRIKQGNSPAQIIEETVPQTLLYKTTFYAYNTTYTVDVSANVAGTWTAYGTACNVTTLPVPVTQVSLINCGKLLTTNDGQISIDHVPTATAYRLRITTNGQTDSLDEPTNFARIGAMPSYEFNTTYSITVAAMVNGAWTAYGPACNVTTPVLVPQLSTEVCGTVLTTANGEIHEDLIPATLFKFRVTDGVHTDTVQSSVGSILLSSLSFYAYNKVYTVQVAVQRNGVWTAFGPACNVTTLHTPVTQVAAAYCGKLLTTNDGEIRADDLPLATAYRFRITEGAHIDSLDAATSFVRLAAMPSFAFNTTYSIQVSAMVNGVWIAYGAACNVTTPAPVTQLSTSYCGTVLPTWNAQVQADPVVFANAYQFRVTQGTNVQTILSPTNNLRLSDVTFFAFNTVFSIEVAAKEGNALAAYGPVCSITTPAPLTNANLSALILSAGTLNPVFDPGALNYTALVSNATTSITLSPTVADATATVKVNETAVISGSPSGSITLNVGANPITTVVTAQDGTTIKSYNTIVTRDKIAQTITFSTLPTKIYGDTDFDPAAASDNMAIPVTYSSSNTAVATIINGQIHIIGAGISTITASQPGDATHYAATDVAKQLTIGQAALTVTANNQSSTYGQALPALTVSYAGFVNGDTDASFTTAATATTIATAASAVNTYPITASGAVDNNYAITYTNGTLTIGQAALIVTADNQSSTYGQALPALTVSYRGFVNGDTDASLTTAATAATVARAASPVSTYPITASGAVDNNYAITYANGTLTIGQATLTVTADNQSKVYGAANPNLSVSYTGFVNGDTDASLTTAATAATIATAASPVSTYPITASGAVDNNYAITYNNGILTIGQAALIVTADNQSSTYGQALPALTVSYAGFVNGDTDASLTTSATATTIVTSASPVNTYPITASGAVDNNYAITYNNGILTIGQAALTVTANNQSSTYGQASPALTVSYAGFVNGDTEASLTTAATATTIATSASPVNTYPITASGAVDNNYMITYASGILTIGQAALTVTADNQSKIYGAANPNLTVSYAGFVNGDTDASLTTAATATTIATAASPVSTYPITASGAVDNNYAITYANGTLTIGQATLTVTADNQSKVYGAANPNLSVSYTGFVNGDTDASLTTAATAATIATAASPVSTYPITASGAVDNNYAITYANGTLTIGQAALTVTADNQNKIYGAANPNLTVSYSGFVNGDTDASLITAATAATIATAASPVNTYPITASGAVDNNYAITYTNGTLTIGQATLTVTADNQNKVYGAANPNLTVSYAGFVNGDTPNSLTTQGIANTTATAASSAGTYAITPSGALDNNYAIIYTNGSLTIGQAALTVTADNQRSTYGQALPALTVSYSGFVNGDTQASLTTAATAITIATATSPVNTYPITVSGAADNNYAITYTNGTLTISQAVLTVTADNQSKVYGAVNPNLTVSYSGFVNGDTQNIITTRPVITTTATQGSNADNYPITVAGAVIPGYTVVYVGGTLTVNKAPLTITADNKSRNYGVVNPALTLSYNGFVNGDMQANLSSPATVNTTAVINSSPGNYPITVSGAASNNYSITSNNGTFTVIPLTNADMSNLIISSGTLSPVYSSSSFAYTTAVAYDVEYLILTPTYDATASATLNGTPVPNGSPAYGIALNRGNNTITTIVTAQDGITKNTYTITVYRATPPNAISPTNILSPNGDGKNDTWVIKDIQLYPKNAVTVFDASGRVIYSKRGYNNDWDGTLKGAPLTQGTYFYVIDLGVGTQPIKGFITILKSH